MYISQDFNKWFSDRGDETLMLDHKINKESNILEIGGYKGVWVSHIIEKYNPNVFIFEPVEEYYNHLCSKFSSNPKVKIFKFGVSNKTQNANISLIDDGSSLIFNSDHKEKIELISFDTMLDYLNLQNIDLMQINIEGAEYDVLEHAIKNNLLKNINKIIVQFHTNVEDCYIRRSNIQNKLQEFGYSKLFDYPFIWEGWAK